ncbi:MAG: hypothetical protein WD270_02665 [Acetobacterales bacterium]
MAKKSGAKSAAAPKKAGAKVVREIDVSSMTDPQRLRNLMQNARGLGREDMYWKAFERLCDLEGEDEDDPLHREFARILMAYEQLVTEKDGKRTAASRTRQKIRRKGVEPSLEDWALAPQPSEGFALLMDHGLESLTGEHLVVKYADRFSGKAVEAAKARLEAHVPPPEPEPAPQAVAATS